MSTKIRGEQRMCPFCGRQIICTPFSRGHDYEYSITK